MQIISEVSLDAWRFWLPRLLAGACFSDLWSFEMKFEYLKGSEKDFDGAPEWATIKEYNSMRYFFTEGHEAGCRVQNITENHEFIIDNGASDFTQLTLLAERRLITEPVWDGEGLPPAGVECEYELYAGEWRKCRIEFVGRELMIVRTGDGEFSCNLYAKFRPIRSPLDVERDKAIEAMRDVGYALPAAIRFTKEEMAALYDAGYRKME